MIKNKNLDEFLSDKIETKKYEYTGAMSALAISVTGLMTVVIAPIISNIFFL